VGVTAASFGEIFSARGFGYAVGTFVAAYLLRCQSFTVSKHAMSCASIIISGLFTTMFAFTNRLDVMLYLGVGQGFGFGILHTFATVAILEMWGQRSQPWLQVKPSALGLGGVVGPLLVNGYGYKNAFILSGIISTLCVSIYGIEYLLMRTRKVVRWSTKKLNLRKSSRSQSSVYLTVDTERISSPTGSGRTSPREADAVDSIYLSRDMKLVDSVLSKTVEGIRQNDLSASASTVMADESASLARHVDHTTTPSISEVLESAPRLTRALIQRKDDQSISTSVRLQSSGSDASQSESSPQVLSYATASMVLKIDIIEETAGVGVDIKIVPVKFSLVMGLLVFFYYGLFYSFSGWVTSYAFSAGIAPTTNDASALTSQYFLWVTVGSAVSVPWSVLVSTTTLLRFQLFVVAAGAMVLLYAGTSYHLLNIATAVIGFGNSSIFPLLICLANDYHFTM
jgi:hypothetical protein